MNACWKGNLNPYSINKLSNSHASNYINNIKEFNEYNHTYN